jgi:hypothetical protein
MPYLLQAAFWVGVVGTVVAAPLLCILRLEGSYLARAAFQWSSPAVLFLTAALSFMAAYSLLPSTRWRTRIAGVLAGVITFFGFSIITAVMVDLTRGWSGSWPRFIQSFAIVFVMAGWIPLGGGWFAGWLVSKLPDTPAEEAA